MLSTLNNLASTESGMLEGQKVPGWRVVLFFYNVCFHLQTQTHTHTRASEETPVPVSYVPTTQWYNLLLKLGFSQQWL
jgi:hypothetical protein